MAKKSNQTGIQSHFRILGLNEKQSIAVASAAAFAVIMSVAVSAQQITTTMNQSTTPGNIESDEASQPSVNSPATTEPIESESNIDTSQAEPQQTEQTQNSNKIQTEITVNDHQIAVPQNGSSHQVLNDASGNSKMDVSVDSNSSSSDSSSHSSTNLRIRSSTNSSTNIHNSE